MASAVAAPAPSPAGDFDSRVRGALWGCLMGDSLSMPVQ